MAATRTGTQARITEVMVEELLRDKGKELPYRLEQFNNEVTRDSIRHWADGIGDANPLWRDEEYAKKTRWGGIIAPPTWLTTCGQHVGRAGMPGIHALYAGCEWHFSKPLQLYDWITVSGGLEDLVEKKSEFAGRSFIQIQFVNYRNQRGELVGKLRSWVIRAERDTAAQRGKYKFERHVYTEEELQCIWEGIEAEEVRGATPRYWEDVQVGEELRPVVKGPYTLSDAIGFKMGWGSHAVWHIRANETRHWVMKRHPGIAIRNRCNVPDVPELVHQEQDVAASIGIPGFYDYGAQRIAWLGHLVTNWMGDDGWLKHLRVELRRPNCEGDVQWCKGKVTHKYVDGQEHLVECQILAENQRGEVTAPGSAIVSLPSRG